MQIVKQIWEKFQRVAELTFEVLENGIDFISFQEKLRRELDGLGQEILKEVLEAKDAYLREHREKRPGWQIERRDDPKEMPWYNEAMAGEENARAQKRNFKQTTH
ncbi:hypothetical protein Daud_1447 [Candidatus Desulforudis audaxviator MP104C]|uniref:Uncharacterized protein n=1 Tax=Desulforudis audaxviator (strain MP104C) TaxID=477974 RepID=B1I4P4_DESAP|nr:hypothetical protein Daud_1447 [Candidatus Desulforudis audaxviator MP104C]AZK59968.1 protein of unknown function UPF0236 [Candidatus Desulforudis audaxviator]